MRADAGGRALTKRPDPLASAKAQTETQIVRFFVPGRPRTTQTGSVVTVNGRSFPIRRGTAWSSLCGLVARQYAPAVPLTGALRCELTFRLRAPKAPRSLWPMKRPDLDNLCKGLLDSWNGVLWDEDSQIVELAIQKVYARDGRVGVAVTVEAL